MDERISRILWTLIPLLICFAIATNVENGWWFIFAIANVAGYLEGKLHG